MARRIIVNVAWNGSWDVIRGRHVYVGDNITAKLFSITPGITVEGLQSEVAKRMGSDYNPNQEMVLRYQHAFDDYDKLPATVIETEQDLIDLFDIWESTKALAMYVTMQDNDLGIQYMKKMVPVRTVSPDNGERMAICGLDDFEDTREGGEYFQGYHFVDEDTAGNEGNGTENEGNQTENEGNGTENEGNGTGNEPVMEDGTYNWATSLENHPMCLMGPGVVPSNQREDGLAVQMGELFEHPDHLKRRVIDAAAKNGWQFHCGKRDYTRVTFKCTDESCSWFVGAYKHQEAVYYKVKKHHKLHTCTAKSIDFKHRNVTRTVIAKDMLDRFADPNNIPTNAEVRAHAKKDLHSECSSWNAWSTIQKAMDLIGGSREENYADLASFFYLTAELNPGTDWDIVVGEDKRFLYCFFALGPQLQGIKLMRPVIVVDATHLKKEPGQLVVATMTDSQRGCYPIAYGILDTESNNAYCWWLSKLAPHLPKEGRLTFVSDRHNALLFAVKEIFPDANHVNCYHHIKMNCQSLYPTGKWKDLYHSAAFTFNADECLKYIHDMRKTCKATNSKNGLAVADYLVDGVGLPVWARSFCETPRFEVLTSNHVESINSMLLKARRLKPVGLFEFIVDNMRAWFFDRREKGAKMGGTLTDVREEIMLLNSTESIGYVVHPISNVKMNVVGDPKGEFVVDFNRRTCTCGEFQQMLMPCKHACACSMMLRQLNPQIADHDVGSMYRFTSVFYSVGYFRDAYAPEIQPAPLRQNWDRDAIPSHIKAIAPLPPVKIVKPGRDQETRFPSTGERTMNARKKYKCSKCGQGGHTKKKCSQP